MYFLLNQFRYFSINQRISILPELFFNQAHFDAYQNFVDVLRTDFVTYGNQLVGVYFFIPRAFGLINLLEVVINWPLIKLFVWPIFQCHLLVRVMLILAILVF